MIDNINNLIKETDKLLDRYMDSLNVKNKSNVLSEVSESKDFEKIEKDISLIERVATLNSYKINVNGNIFLLIITLPFMARIFIKKYPLINILPGIMNGSSSFIIRKTNSAYMISLIIPIIFVFYLISNHLINNKKKELRITREDLIKLNKDDTEMNYTYYLNQLIEIKAKLSIIKGKVKPMVYKKLIEKESENQYHLVDWNNKDIYINSETDIINTDETLDNNDTVFLIKKNIWEKNAIKELDEQVIFIYK